MRIKKYSPLLILIVIIIGAAYWFVGWTNVKKIAHNDLGKCVGFRDEMLLIDYGENEFSDVDAISKKWIYKKGDRENRFNSIYNFTKTEMNVASKYYFSAFYILERKGVLESTFRVPGVKLVALKLENDEVVMMRGREYEEMAMLIDCGDMFRN